MSTYTIILSPKAARQLKKLKKLPISKRIKECIDFLTLDPRPIGVKKLTGEHSLYRVRVGDYRIIYEIKDKQLKILVLNVAARKDVYK